MAKQQRLEIEAIEQRKKLIQQNDYQKGADGEYNETNPDALATGDPFGKGTGVSMGVASRPGESTSKAISYTNVNTKDGGGQYDVEGRNGVGGRNRLMLMNLYQPDEQYGVDSVDTSKNVTDGQFVVK